METSKFDEISEDIRPLSVNEILAISGGERMAGDPEPSPMGGVYPEITNDPP